MAYDFSFDPEFEKSIEAKARAEQNKLRALTEKETAITQAEGEAEAAVKKAEGEAKAIRLQTEALRTNPGYSEYLRAKKWNGQLPTVVGGNSIVRIDELAAGASGK